MATARTSVIGGSLVVLPPHPDTMGISAIDAQTARLPMLSENSRGRRMEGAETIP